MILLLKMVLRSSTEVLSSVSRGRKAMICLKEKIPVLGTLHSGLSYSAVGYEFSVNQSTVFIK